LQENLRQAPQGSDHARRQELNVKKPDSAHLEMDAIIAIICLDWRSRPALGTHFWLQKLLPFYFFRFPKMRHSSSCGERVTSSRSSQSFLDSKPISLKLDGISLQFW